MPNPPNRKNEKTIAVDPAKRLLNVQEVAAQLGVSRYTVWRLRDRGVFAPSTVIGSQSRWAQRDVDAYVEANRCRLGDGGIVKRKPKHARVSAAASKVRRDRDPAADRNP